ncbi:unnamed protein product, partial [marine sediment metagenome]
AALVIEARENIKETVTFEGEELIEEADKMKEEQGEKMFKEKMEEDIRTEIKDKVREELDSAIADITDEVENA